MEWSQVGFYGFQTVITIMIGLIAWGMKNAMKTIETSIVKLQEEDNKIKETLRRLEEAHNDLKSDLPLIYVLREDFIRIMNGFDTKIDKLIDSVLQQRRDG